jgi:hypothetical membrane protein
MRRFDARLLLGRHAVGGGTFKEALRSKSRALDDDWKVAIRYVRWTYLPHYAEIQGLMKALGHDSGNRRQVSTGDGAAKSRNIMKSGYLLAPLSSMLISAVYLPLMTVALLKYPEAFSPTSNWLSDLGNRILSPEGSAYYNSGVIASGSLLIMFFLALRSIQLKNSKPQGAMVYLSQAFGIVGAIGMILSGLFSIDDPSKHGTMSAILRIGIGTAFGFTIPALLYHKGARRWILAIGGATAVLDLIVSVFFNNVQILEWPVILLFLVYCVLLGIETGRLGRANRQNTGGVSWPPR